MAVDESNVPTIRYLQSSQDHKKYTFEHSLAHLTAIDIHKFINQVKAGEHPQSLRSQSEPLDDGPVTTIVAKTFSRIVNNYQTDVFVKFFAPWCNHCLKLAPDWMQLANEVANIEDLIIAKFDVTANDLETEKITSYPTLRLYTKTNKDGIDYKGERDIESLKKWLLENSSAYKNG